MKILVLNAGSSSVKFELFEKKNGQLLSMAADIIDGICHCEHTRSACLRQAGSGVRLFFKNKREEGHSLALVSGTKQSHRACVKAIKTHEEAIKTALHLLLKKNLIKHTDEITHVAHRVVHGGETFKKPTKLTDAIVKKLEKMTFLAPLHNPENLEGIKIARKLFPKADHYAIFDTAFHTTLPEKAFRYALPEEWYTRYNIRKYGFHGISHEYVSQKAIEHLKKKRLPWEKIITCHMGNGVSITAIRHGKSVDTSMGVTPLEGLIMGTRCGSIDPAIPLIMQKRLKKTPDEMETILNKKSGLLALSGISSDMRIIREKAPKNKKAWFAMEIFSYHLAQWIGAYTTALNGLDCLIFTGGMGENAGIIREKICKNLKFLDLCIDRKKNQKNAFEIHASKSKVKVLVIPTDEELAMAEKIWYNE